MLFEEIAENKFCLRLTVRLRAAIKGYVNCLVKEFGQFFRASSLYGLLYLANNIRLRIQYRILKTCQ